MNDTDLLKGFSVCKEEIISLRNRNNEMRIELNAMNRVLSAVNSHRHSSGDLCASQDILWKIKDTEKFLEEKINSEK